MRNKYLPTEYNLHFLPNDIYAIIVETDEEKNELIEFIKKEAMYLQGVESLVETFKEHLAKN